MERQGPQKKGPNAAETLAEKGDDTTAATAAAKYTHIIIHTFGRLYTYTGTYTHSIIHRYSEQVQPIQTEPAAHRARCFL